MAPSHPPFGSPFERQDRGAQIVEDREKERIRIETLRANATVTNNSTADTTANLNTTMVATRRQVASTSTTNTYRRIFIFSGPPGPLPSAYGAILNSGRS